METYEHLEGKIVYLDYPDFVGEGLVVACDKDIGITIVDAEDHENYLVCLTGPSSPKWKENFNKKMHFELFDAVVNMINIGHLNTKDTDSILHKYHVYEVSSATKESCPFS